MPQEVDNSSGGQLWAEDPRWGPLSGHLLHTSYEKGCLYYLMMQEVGDVTQAAIIKLPHQFTSGIMRARMNPAKVGKRIPDRRASRCAACGGCRR